MRALLDTDAFCKLAVGGVLHDGVQLLGAKLQECGRLPALPYMLRRGRLRRVFGAEACDAIIPIAEGMPLAPHPSDLWLERLTPIAAIDPGEAQMFAAAAETGLFLVSGDKRALRALKDVADLADALAGRIATFEAVLIGLCDHLGSDEVRRRVQVLTASDKVVQVCFSAENPDPQEALLSYQQSLADEVSPLVLWNPQQGALGPLEPSAGRWRVTFSSRHYLPVLKIKRGEKKALQAIEPLIRQRITPLLEIVERTDKELDEHLKTAFKDLGDSVGNYARCFLDAREIAPDGPAGAAEVFDRASSAGIVFTPVTGITRSADVTAALSHRTRGVALRLTRDEFEAGHMTGSLGSFMSQHGLALEETDLIVDLGPVDDLVVDGVSALTDAFLAEVPDHTRWRTFTVSGCAFPASMGGVGQHSHDLVERAEWIAWRDNLHSRRQGLARLPTFSDCAIQHPMGVEGFDPRTMQVSAAVRYAKDDAWLLIKGESTRRKPPSEQFPVLATQLVYGHLRSHFAGASHCDGCAGMKAAADGAPRLGSAEAWRRLGTIHHITTAALALESLPWP